MKLRLLAACLVLVAVAASGCTDEPDEPESSGPPTEAEFCGAFQDFYDALGSFGGDEVADYVQELKESAEQVGGIGVPKGMPSDAEAGLEFYLGSVEDLADDATLKDIGQLIDLALTDEQRRNAEALQHYLEGTCPDLGIAP